MYSQCVAIHNSSSKDDNSNSTVSLISPESITGNTLQTDPAFEMTSPNNDEFNGSQSTDQMAHSPPFKTHGHISKQQYKNYKIALWYYISPAGSLIGALGNVLGIWIVLREKLRQPFHLYLFVLLIADLIFLSLSVLRNILIILEERNKYIADHLSCYYSLDLRLTQSTVYNTCAYLITLMSFERLVNIVFPLRVKLFSLRKYTILLIAVATVGNAAPLIPPILFKETAEITNHKTNTTKCVNVPTKWAQQNIDFQNWYMTAMLVLARFIPAVATLANNVILSICLARHNSRRATLFERKLQKSERHDQIKTSITLMILSICLVLSLIPTAIASILKNYYPQTYGRNAREFYTQMFLRDFGYLLRVFSASADPFIYIVMSKRTRLRSIFKKTICSMCGHSCCKDDHGTVEIKPGDTSSSTENTYIRKTVRIS